MVVVHSRLSMLVRAAAAGPLLVLAFAAFAGCANPGVEPGPGSDHADARASGDVVVSWNERILGAAEEEDGFLTLKGVRTATMAHMAMHDALNAIDPRFAPFALQTALDGAQGVHPVAAANEAAYAVVVSQYPDRLATWDAERARWSDAADTVARALGERAAAAILIGREDDGWAGEAEYVWHPMGPGVYAAFNAHSGTPEGFVFGAGWAKARPFLLDSASQFRPGPPPAIDSDAYRRAFDEVKRVGARESATRTADQTHLAMWWKEFVESSHNRLARELATADELDAWQAARLFALLNAVVFDGYVAVFDAKFHYNHWRPYTAIRWAAHDGNPGTEPDSAWTNLHDHTYAFPSYPSAHGTACAAAAVVLGDVFGEDRPFEMTIPLVDSAGPFSGKMRMDPATRAFDSFNDAAVECSLSRLYLGIHFRYDSEVGTWLGGKVGATPRAR